MDLVSNVAIMNLYKMAIAYLLALPIGFNREREATGAGLRTFPLVAVASCGFCWWEHRVFKLGFGSMSGYRGYVKCRQRAPAGVGKAG